MRAFRLSKVVLPPTRGTVGRTGARLLIVAALLVLQLGFPREARAQVNLSKYARTPFGYVWPSCVHVVPSGSRIDRNRNVRRPDGTLIETLPKCTVPMIPTFPHADVVAINTPSVPATGGWIEDSEYSDSNKVFNYIADQWNVPDAPAESGQLLYFFDALQAYHVGPSNYIDIIQPVLQWGVSPIGGGDYWGMADWWVEGTSDGTGSWTLAVTPLVTVHTGDTILGIIELGRPAGYVVESIDESNSGGGEADEGLTVDLTGSYPGIQFTDAFPAVLEEYGVTTCDQYPDGSNGSTNFMGIGMQDECNAREWWCRQAVGTDPSTWQQQDWQSNGSHGPDCNFSVSNGNIFGILISSLYY